MFSHLSVHLVACSGTDFWVDAYTDYYGVQEQKKILQRWKNRIPALKGVFKWR